LFEILGETVAQRKTVFLGIGIPVAFIVFIVGFSYLHGWLNDKKMGKGWLECLQAPDAASLIKLCDENIEHGGGWDDDTKAFFASRIADAYERQKDMDRAIEYYKKASNFQPNKARYLLSLAALLNDQGDCNATLSVADKAVSIEPTKGAAFFWRGISYMCLKDYERAAANFSTAILLNPIHPKYYDARAAALNAKGDKDGAEVDWAKAKSLESRFFEAVKNEND
jgi:tetratricopeptide (TPR) repeat protein